MLGISLPPSFLPQPPAGSLPDRFPPWHPRSRCGHARAWPIDGCIPCPSPRAIPGKASYGVAFGSKHQNQKGWFGFGFSFPPLSNAGVFGALFWSFWAVCRCKCKRPNNQIPPHQKCIRNHKKRKPMNHYEPNNEFGSQIIIPYIQSPVWLAIAILGQAAKALASFRFEGGHELRVI